LSLPGALAVAECPWDKLVQRRALRAAGLSAIESHPVDTPDDLRQAVRSIGLPCVLKPRRGTASEGVAFLDEDGDVRRQLAARSRWRNLLVETRLPAGVHPSGAPWLGDFISVETVSTGRHQPVAVVDKLPVSVVRRLGTHAEDSIRETGDVTPSRLSNADQVRVLEFTAACLSVLGVRWRVTHTELRLTVAGPEVIEVNGRTGGYVSRLICLTGGSDLVRLALDLAVGIDPPPSAAQDGGHAMTLLPAFPDRCRPVRSDVSIEDLRRLPGVVSVDEVAVRGALPRGRDHRMASLTLFAETRAALDQAFSLTTAGISQLFAADLDGASPYQTPSTDVLGTDATVPMVGATDGSNPSSTHPGGFACSHPAPVALRTS
jgi:hypothetical protein